MIDSFKILNSVQQTFQVAKLGLDSCMKKYTIFGRKKN